jgi:hypothetical protein
MAPAATRAAVSLADGATAAAIVAHAVFHVIGKVGMAGPVAVGDVAVILRPSVDIVDDQGDGRSRGDLTARALVLEHA